MYSKSKSISFYENIQLLFGNKDLTMANKTKINQTNKILIFVDNTEKHTIINLMQKLSEDFHYQYVFDVNRVYDNLMIERPQLLILCVHNHFENCFNLCFTVKNNLLFSELPIVIVATSAVSIQHQIRFFECGVDDFITLPIHDHLLWLRLNNIINRQNVIKNQWVDSEVKHCFKTNYNREDDVLLQKIIVFIQNNFSNPKFNVNEIIHNVGMSRSAFYKKFKSLSLISIHELINNIRLQKAEKLLKHTSLPISEIALECGFDDPSYFCRVFKRKYNVSPKKFKMNNDKLTMNS